MKTALVTGSGGFIGRHMTAALTAAGYQVQGLDIRLPCLWWQSRDARDYFRHADDTFDVVVHAAAVVGGRRTIDHAPFDLTVNLELDAGMFVWAARTRPGRIIYLSSSAAYPVHLQKPGRRLTEPDITLDGDATGQPDQLYGWAKLTGEKLATAARSNGLAVTVVRPFSGYAEDQDTDYPFPAMIARARAREDPFTVWGPGTQVRDFIHVDDITAAILTMIEEGIDGPVNLGTGQATSMTGLARLVCEQAGYEPEIRPDPAKPAGVAWRVADPTRLRQFHTARVSLAGGIARALQAAPA